MANMTTTSPLQSTHQTLRDLQDAHPTTSIFHLYQSTRVLNLATHAILTHASAHARRADLAYQSASIADRKAVLFAQLLVLIARRQEEVQKGEEQEGNTAAAAAAIVVVAAGVKMLETDEARVQRESLAVEAVVQANVRAVEAGPGVVSAIVFLCGLVEAWYEQGIAVVRRAGHDEEDNDDELEDGEVRDHEEHEVDGAAAVRRKDTAVVAAMLVLHFQSTAMMLAMEGEGRRFLQNLTRLLCCVRARLGEGGTVADVAAAAAVAAEAAARGGVAARREEEKREGVRDAAEELDAALCEYGIDYLDFADGAADGFAGRDDAWLSQIVRFWRQWAAVVPGGGLREDFVQLWEFVAGRRFVVGV